ncbi:MAG: glycosyltransferase family 4 protein [Clostridiaceae bacterium]
MKIRNVALFDSTEEEAADFINGLSDSTGLIWEASVYRSNEGRKSKLDNMKRYSKYFIFPFKIFLHRKEYDNIVAWQAFYGLIYAFYCRFFRVDKVNTLLIKNFTYKPKKGIIGAFYFRFMNYVVKSDYIDVFVCSSQTFCDYCSRTFNEAPERFVFLPFGINDFSKLFDTDEPAGDDYILSLGRSNRDWDFLIDSLAETRYPVRIVCDELHRVSLPSNIKIYNNVWEKESYSFIRNCKCMVIPIKDGSIGSGETVLLQAMSFAKPIIITKPSCLADDYVSDGVTGLVINKNKTELLEAVNKIFYDADLCRTLSANARQLFLDKHSLYSYGTYLGKTLIGKGCLKRQDCQNSTNKQH